MEKLDSYHLPVTGRNILRFAFPTIVMTVFNTFYTMVDGLFVSNLIGRTHRPAAPQIPESRDLQWSVGLWAGW